MIKLKSHHNYVAFFLSLSCNLSCAYCINLHNGASRYKQAKRKELNYKDWIKAANKLTLRKDLPLSLQGGEPTLLKGFNIFLKEVNPEIKMDLLTNMMFDVDKFIKEVPVERFTRDAPYASIRVSYHPGQNDIDDLIYKTQKMEASGFRVGLFGIELPDEKLNKHILEVKERCINLGIDFRTKEFLGEFNGKMYGTFKYKNSVSSSLKNCKCKTTELIVDPNGYTFKCHSDLYAGRDPYGNILDDNFSSSMIDEYRDCNFYGDCNPCDVKVKTNRYQQSGHTSVDIINIKDIK